MEKEAQQIKEIKISQQIADKIKRQWEELAKRQQNSGVKLRANRKITSVTFARDHQGKIAVQVNLYNGRSVTDNGQEKTIDTFKLQSRRAYARIRVAEFLKRIRENGYAAVEGDIPAELKEAVLKGMAQANISTSYKGTKAEAAAAKQASQNAAQAADNAIKGAAAPLAAGLGLAAAAGPNYQPYSIKVTPAVKEALAKGVTFKLPPARKDIPDSLRSLIETTVGKTLDTAAQTTRDMPVQTISVNRIGSESATATLADGRVVKGSAHELHSKDIAQQAYLRLLDTPRDKYTENDKKLEQIFLETLKHKHIIPQDATRIPDGKINEVKDYISKHTGELRSRKAAKFFPEELRQQYIDAKRKEKEYSESKQIGNAKKGASLETPSNSQPAKTERQKLKEKLKNMPSLLSEIADGQKKSSDYSFDEVIQDARTHKRSKEDAMRGQILNLFLKQDPSLTRDSKIPEEMMQRTNQLVREFSEQTAKNPKLNFQVFLQQKGLISKKENKQPQPSEKAHQPHSNEPAPKQKTIETERVSDALRKNMVPKQTAPRKKEPLQKSLANSAAKSQQGQPVKKQKNELALDVQMALKKRGQDLAR